MKKPILISTLIVGILASAVLRFIYVSGPRHADKFTRHQQQYELCKLTIELQSLRVMLDGPEAASTSLLAGHTRQLASLAASPKDTQEHRDLVQRLTQAIANEQRKIDAFQQRRRYELAPLEQRVVVMQRQFANQ